MRPKRRGEHEHPTPVLFDKSAPTVPNKGIVSMSSEHSNFAQKFAAAFREISRASDPKTVNDTDRLIALIEAATEAFDEHDPHAVEAVFVTQRVTLDVIFKDFIRRKYYTFDNMRVALRAQAQCRATFKSLNDYRNPRLKPSPTKNSGDQTVESANLAAGANA